jgi:ribosome biogenesis ATPase
VRGRFAKEITLPVPDAIARTKILQYQAREMRHLGSDVDFALLGKMTPGYVGADLKALVREAGMIAVSRIIHSNSDNNNENNSGASNGNGKELTNNDQPIVGIDAVTNNGKDEENTMMILTTDGQEEEQQALTQPLQTQDPSAVNNVNSLAQAVVPLDYSQASIEMKDFLLAIKSIQPTAKREGFAVAPDISWNDIGALVEVRDELNIQLLAPIAHPERFKALGLEVPAGILFFGPPGCGKTLLAKAIANESGANFISVKGPELLNMYVGESESRVRQVFARARASSPCVIFFDELDALCPKRSSGFDGSSGGNGVSERVVNQLLTELDGLESRRDVYIIAATNRLELIDDAMLRPGRLGNLLYIPLPTAEDRVSILQALTRKVNLQYYSEEHQEGVQLEVVARDPRAEGFSGADLSALVREAGLAVIKEISLMPAGLSSPSSSTAIPIVSNPVAVSTNNKNNNSENSVQVPELVAIKARHFEKAFTKVKPSVNKKDRLR